MFTNGHVSACIDGVIHDWADKKSLRVEEIWIVTKTIH